MGLIDKSVTNNYYCGSPELVAAIDRLTDAVKALKPTIDPETDPRYTKALQNSLTLIQLIKRISD